MREISCASINLNHAKAANIQLSHDLIHNKIDVCIINEPYYWEDNIIGFPNNFKVFYQVGKPRAGVIICNNDYRIRKITIERDLVALHIEIGKDEYFVISIYCPPSEEIDNKIRELERVINTIMDKKIIIGGDFNAKSPAWGPRNIDQRGEILMEFIEGYGLNIENDINSIPTYSATKGESWIDLTLTKNMDNNIKDWKVTDMITLSDHNEIRFVIKDEIIYNENRTRKWRIKPCNFYFTCPIY